MGSDLLSWATGIPTLIIIISLLVVAHEWGHFAAAKWFKMRVEDFSLFFGPVLWKIGKRNGTEYHVRSIPFGGFVKIAGMEPDDLSSGQPILQAVRSSVSSAIENDPLARLLKTLQSEGIVSIPLESISDDVRNALRAAFGADGQMTPSGRADLQALRNTTHLTDGERTLIGMALDADERARDASLYSNRPIYQRAIVIFAGPLASLAFGFVLFCIMGFTVGLPSEPTNQIMYVTPKSVAQQADLRIGDRIVAIDGAPIRTGKEMIDRIHASKGKRIILTVERGGERLLKAVTPATVTYRNDRGVEVSEGRIGIAPNYSMRRAGPVESVVNGSLRTYVSLYFLIHTLEHRQTEEVGGPIMMGQMTTAMQKLGIAHLLTMAAGLSLSLGVMNLLPIPILDGGHLLLLALEKIRRRRLSTREMVGAQMVGLGLIAMLVVFVMYNDIARTLSGNAPR